MLGILPPMLTLYTKPGCPYCAKVKEFVSENHISLTEKSTDEPGVFEEILERGGLKQVPLLIDDEDNIPIYGSDEVIAELHKRFI